MKVYLEERVAIAEREQEGVGWQLGRKHRSLSQVTGVSNYPTDLSRRLQDVPRGGCNSGVG